MPFVKMDTGKKNGGKIENKPIQKRLYKRLPHRSNDSPNNNPSIQSLLSQLYAF